MEIHCCFPEAIGFHGGFSLSEYHPSPIFMCAHTHTYAYIYTYIYMCIIHISVCVRMRVHTVCVWMGRYDTIYVQDLCTYGKAKYQCLYSNTDIYCVYIYIHLKVLYETRYYSLFRSFPFSQQCQCQSHFTCNPQVCFGSSRCDMYIASDQCHHWSAAW